MSTHTKKAHAESGFISLGIEVVDGTPRRITVVSEKPATFMTLEKAMDLYANLGTVISTFQALTK